MRKAVNVFLFEMVIIFPLIMLFFGCKQEIDDLTNPDQDESDYCVTYHGNGNTEGTVPVDTNIYTELSGEVVIILGNTGKLRKTGYAFCGWNDYPEGGNIKYLPTKTFHYAGKIDLYAQWSPLGPGALDETFNSGSGADMGVYSVALQNDGSILAAGRFASFNGSGQNGIVRLLPNGLVDTSFNAGCNVDTTINQVHVLSDGKILVAGKFDSFYGVFRLNPDGFLDSGFDYGVGASHFVYCLEVQNDGKLLVGGTFGTYNGVSCPNIIRLNEDGSIDTSFSPIGSIDIEMGIYSICVQPDGKIIIGGDDLDHSIARLNNDGSLDASFTSSIGGMASMVLDIALVENNKILVVGDFEWIAGITTGHIARLNEDGTLDTSFVPYLFTSDGYADYAQTVAVDASGKILIGGGFYGPNGTENIIRLHPDGSLDTGFRAGFDTDWGIACFAEQPDGKILIGGEFIFFNGIDCYGIARLLN